MEKHFDKTIKDYVDLLDLLVNSKIPLEATAHPSAYPNLIKNLSEIADKNIYVQCCDEIDRIEDNRQKTYFVFVNRIILLKYGKKRWKIWIKENLSNNMEYEIFQLLYEYPGQPVHAERPQKYQPVHSDSSLLDYGHLSRERRIGFTNRRIQRRRTAFEGK